MSGAKGYDKILVVDDSPSTRMFARASISRLRLTVVEAGTGTEALTLFDQQNIGLVLLDVGLPDLDGFEVAKRIRAHPKGALTPIIMLTGKDDVESIQRAFEAGATDFASKPVSGLILGQRLLFALEGARRQREIESQRRELEETQRHAQIGSWTYRAESDRLQMSEGGRQIFDLPHGDDLMRVIAERTPESERDRLFPRVKKLLTTGGELEIKHVLVDSNGKKRAVYTHARKETSGSGVPIISGYSQEITAREKAEQRARYLAQHDSLTGLKNQEFFRETLSVILAQQRRNKTTSAVLLVNLDHFSRINDVRGREVGDLILRETAERLTQCLRETNMVTAGLPEQTTIARVGGDEFSILLAEIKHPTDVARVAMRILHELKKPISAGQEKVVVTGRIGIAISPEDGEELGQLISNADAANRHARDAGGSGFEFYRSTMNEDARMRLGLENDFRQALLRKEILVNYQPRVDMSTGIVVGAEALARWKHAKLGWVSPEIFVQLAEEAGLTFEFGRQIIESTLEQMSRWRTVGYEPINVSINISPTLLIDSRLPDLLVESMEAYGIPASQVEVEITESVLVRSEKDATVALGKLKALGLSIALDDFGTGYSSLNHLQHFPVDVVKIDRSFVLALVDERGRAIVRGVISMAHAMGLRVVAEGVETLEQRLFLAEEDCDEEQGYLVSKPVPASEFEELFWPAGVVPILAEGFEYIGDDDVE